VLRLTVDTNLVYGDRLARIRAASEGLGVDIKPTTVTHREHTRAHLAFPTEPIDESGVYDESRYDTGVIYEPLVVGESLLGFAVLAGDDEPPLFEAILDVIGSGSFPPLGQRDDLSPGQRRQLRDAMILLAHTRDRRDVFVTEDRKGFVGPSGEKRRTLEGRCATKIMTVDEYCEYTTTLRATAAGEADAR
jgi:hypothetical protein